MEKQKLISLLQPKDYERVYIHNEIFTELKNTDKIKSATNIAFAYCYYCLNCYLFRYCKYGNAYWFTKETLIEMLGFARNNKTFDYLIKKNGLLDRLGLTETVSDLPVQSEFDDQFVSFIMYKALNDKEIFTLPHKYTVKKPIKAFRRYEDDVFDGTFYDISNTHLFSIHRFIQIISNPDLGAIGFFMFQYLLYNCAKFPSGYFITLIRLSEELSLSTGTIQKYINNLEKTGNIRIEQPKRYLKEGEWKRYANTYFINH
ncbi:HTH domain-containing protein [Paenibacillus chitinolyticus]|uniref:HTH domain-containing protein n=1 Tax=Paenibacillus chitinolyticus TaxID=79263 RepID=A0A410WTL7_9BACL|nr:HTH domain-containing protein [Paenibacillus chitinolyticus]MCY9588635.1 HTH domain-containing protein [Paenibacillus chitinolyticus]MCY9595861.1 HTH domain-containing protein [Paenibacillus chitinolyticus]QAV17607.1 HTH domain-containing protein [Paenibacillus chitinolyticus]